VPTNRSTNDRRTVSRGRLRPLGSERAVRGRPKRSNLSAAHRATLRRSADLPFGMVKNCGASMPCGKPALPFSRFIVSIHVCCWRRALAMSRSYCLRCSKGQSERPFRQVLDCRAARSDCTAFDRCRRIKLRLPAAALESGNSTPLRGRSPRHCRDRRWSVSQRGFRALLHVHSWT